ncbi:hypothetical protein AVEN_254505-1 [Araneus ventricosus]|uniref:Uncharacterized protein n=1 Tax=Araneus ventricosus TaxID=182803 RepID=A0A4Y2RK45_ARAVE|nr:hypothetical protein AVEN_254505-1 [Araneus ventricosus]
MVVRFPSGFEKVLSMDSPHKQTVVKNRKLQASVQREFFMGESFMYCRLSITSSFFHVAEPDDEWIEKIKISSVGEESLRTMPGFLYKPSPPCWS